MSSVIFGTYSPPELEIVEALEYKLESTYAHEQLSSLAYELSEMQFIFFTLEVFGYEIEVSALSKLYKDLSDKKIEPPEIVVSQFPVGRFDNYAGYSNKRKKIIVYQKLLDEAIADKDKRAELFAALVEEYGHHIDNLLRTELATNGKKDKDIIDEGAKFAYRLFKFDIFNEASLTYAKAETPDFNGDLVVDFSKLNKAVSTYVAENQQYDEIPGKDISNYAAGRNRKTDKNAAFGHGDIEFEALYDEKTMFSEKEVLNIYYGNWLRDFSQVIVGFTVRSTNFGIKAQKYKVVKEATPMKLSHSGWVDLIEILAIKEFIYDPLKDQGKEPEDNYNDLKKTFDTHFGGLDKDILGIYRPEEHLDNPKGLEDESHLKDDDIGKRISFTYTTLNGVQPKYLYAGDNQDSWQIDEPRKMSKFFWEDDQFRPSSVTYMKEQLALACAKGYSIEGFRSFGAALHVLEDFFAHTNFTEIALRKQDANVYPWIQNYENKSYEKLPVVSGTFLTEDTIASVGPKMADLLFDPKIHDYKRRIPGNRTLSEMFLLKALKNFAKGQKSDTAKTNDTYLGVEFATWLYWYETILAFQDWMAAEYIKADDMEWASTDFFEKFGATVAETFSKNMGYLVDVLTFIPKLVINIILGSLDEVIPEAQSHLKENYGNSPSHSQIAKDSFKHPLNKLTGELAKEAVKDVGIKFKAGWEGGKLANYVADTYFVHPKDATWCDKMIQDWKNNKANSAALDDLKYGNEYEHVHHEMQEISKESLKKFKEVMEYFKTKTK